MGNIKHQTNHMMTVTTGSSNTAAFSDLETDLSHEENEEIHSFSLNDSTLQSELSVQYFGKLQK